jgi:XTP/dITP diphosphohydrolase
VAHQREDFLEQPAGVRRRAGPDRLPVAGLTFVIADWAFKPPNAQSAIITTLAARAFSFFRKAALGGLIATLQKFSGLFTERSETNAVRKVVLASHNPKKARELRRLLKPLRAELLTFGDFPGATPPEETGRTFAENAVVKALYAMELSGMAALADDSGLMADALDGAPGVYSARFAGPDADDAANNRLLLERLAAVPEARRGAKFVSVVAAAVPGQGVETFTGEARGRILRAPRGENGFGYDPLFLSDDLGVTFAEAGDAEKNRVSHRGRAMRAFLEWAELRLIIGH